MKSENIKLSGIEIERQKINHIDEALIKLLDKRFEVVSTIVAIKKQIGTPIFQPGREREVLNHTSSLSKNSVSMQEIFRKIMQESRKIQGELI